jgi:DNA polymerase III alpha subunit
MAFVNIYEYSMELENFLFPKVYAKYKNLIDINKTYLITYKIEIREEKEQAIIDSIYNLD